MAVHARRGDKLGGCTVEDPADPAFRQFPGLNRTFAELLERADGLRERVFGKTRVSVFAMSDDENWLAQEHARMGSPAHVEVDGGHGQAAASHNRRDWHERLLVDENVRFFAALALGSRCRALVLNSDSQVSRLLFVLACFRQGTCPQIVDVSEHRSDEEMAARTRAWETGWRPSGCQEEWEYPFDAEHEAGRRLLVEESFGAYHE